MILEEPKVNYPVLINPACEHFSRVEEAINSVNRLQPFFALRLVKAKWVPNDPDEEKKVDSYRVFSLAKKQGAPTPHIIVIQNPFDDNYFSHEYRESFIVTLADWESYFAPPPLTIYLIYQFAGACVNFAADLSEEMIEEWAHNPPIGCFFDEFRQKNQIRLGMVGANLCGDCEVKLAGMGLNDQALSSIEQLLLYVRGATIRRPRATPTHVFIGHGRSPVWLQLQRFLVEELGLEVEEFNKDATAGVATTQRLEEMLRRSCFAFLVMTGEDARRDKRMYARQNVVHEVGFFQGSLGFRRAIVLKEKRVAPFSNIDGLTYISFQAGKLDKAAQVEVCRTLERERIIEPSLSRNVQARLRVSGKRRGRQSILKSARH
jgi:hypothetical protein